MSKKDLEELKKYFKDISPQIWQHYVFLYNVRTKNRGFDFLLASESLLTLIFITLFGNLILNGNLIFLVPLLAFFVSIFFSFSNLVPKLLWFPWFEKDDIEKAFDMRNERDFYEQDLRQIYGVLAHLWEFNKRKGKIFFNNVLSLYISIVLAFASVLIYYQFIILLLLLIPIAILFWSLVQIGWGKEVVLKNPAPEVEKFFDDWKNKELNK